MSAEKNLIASEWLAYARDDLESANIILEQSDNYHISVYHSHQTIEKIFKWFLLKNNRQFPFIHDILELFKLVCELQKIDYVLDDLIFIGTLYPQLRYPTGDKITKEDAEKSLVIAENMFKKLAINNTAR